jgi:hypothetical protein
MNNLAQTQPKGLYIQRNGLTLFKGRIVAPSNLTLRNKLIYEAHDTKMRGHSSYALLKNWPHSSIGL